MANYVIVTKGCGMREEFKAGGTITPGHLLSINSAGSVVVHATSGGNAYPLFAVENDVGGGDISDNYSSGDQVQCVWLRSGEEAYALIADGQNIAIGDLLESNGAGRLTKHVVDSTGIYYHKSIVAVAREAVDMSGSAGVDPSGRCRVQIV